VRILGDDGPTPAECIHTHVALPDARPRDRAFVRLNMIASVDGGSAVGGLSGGLGNRQDHEVFRALRASADGVLVGMSTAVAEHYGAPDAGLMIYVIAPGPAIDGLDELFASGRATLLLPTDAGTPPADVPVLRFGAGRVDLAAAVASLAGQVLVAEGGPTIAGLLVSLGLVDEFFVTLAPRVISGESSRVVHGPEADPSVWELRHGFADEDGFLFLRYARSLTAPG
jgi:riboflavin biosynthesis pyrimidine reductase